MRKRWCVIPKSAVELGILGIAVGGSVKGGLRKTMAS
jgi:hypothetical protein